MRIGSVSDSLRAIAALLALLFAPSALADTDLRDPMRPQRAGVTGATQAEQRFDVTAILYSDGRRVAVLNGQPVRDGDRIGDARIVAIDPGAVRIAYRGEIVTARLKATRVRQ